MSSLGFRLVAAILLLCAAGLLLIPAAAPARRITWDDLIAPLAVGQPVIGGFVLAPPWRAATGDVIYVARRSARAAAPAARVEVHVLDRGRWPDVPQTRSFSVGWEMPRAEAAESASVADANAVRDALRDAIARNDPGSLSVAAVPLASDPPAPVVSRVLERVAGLRGAVIGTAIALALVLLMTLPRGAWLVAVLLFALGFALRAPRLDVPFAHDQDVQRLFTGSLPVRHILTGEGLEDRHPPLYFLVLHWVQIFGQSEAVNRLPAVVASALAGPALLWAVYSMCGAVGSTAVVTALLLTIAPELIAQSRQVSEIPLYALMLLAATTALVTSLGEPRRLRLVTLALAHGLAMSTYYLTPFVWAAHAAVLAWWRPLHRRVLWAFAAGIVLGLPALALGGVTLLRDWGARDVARAFPALAWGEHTPLRLAAQMVRMIVGMTGGPFAALAALAMIIGILRRSLPVVAATAGAAGTFAGIALLSTIARVQDYYITAIVPLIALAVAVLPPPRARAWSYGWQAAVLVAVAWWAVPLLAQARPLYLPAGDAFMPQFAAIVAQRPEATVITVAHYDRTILAYYLARRAGRLIGWHTVDAGDKRVEPLVHVHALTPDAESVALRKLDELLAPGPALVIERDEFLLPRISERLATCEPVAQAPTARLSRCASDGSFRSVR